MKGLTIVMISGITVVLAMVLLISRVQDGSMATAFVASDARTFGDAITNSSVEVPVNSITSAQMIDPATPISGSE